MTRRALLQRGGGLLLAVAGAGVLGGARLAPPALAAPFTLPLRRPTELTGDDIRLRIAAADVEVFPGVRTRMWTFGGEFPGPTIRRPAGATTRVTFEHALPEAGGLTIHHHGHHTASADDGQPTDQFAPGDERTYVYEHTEQGEPGQAALRWYHDHSHGTTGRNSWMGLAGLFIIEDERERELGLPSGEHELPLVLTERRFTAGGQLADVFSEQPGALPFDPSKRAPFDDAVGSGDRTLVNGVPEPYVDVEPRTYRLRVLNASNFHPYNLRIAGVTLRQIGTESGLLPAAVDRDTVLLGPAERADVLIDLSGAAGRTLVLESVAAEGTLPATAPLEHRLLELRVGAGPATPPPALPAELRPLPAWARDLPQVPDRVLAFGVGLEPDGRPSWTINGEVYDAERRVARPELGSTETWLLVNTTSGVTSHYIHLHDVDWKVVSRNGAAPGPGEDGLKETFRLDPGEAVLVGARFTDHLGPYMVHCHMLNHEDHAMMSTFEVVPPGQGDRPADAFAALGPERERVQRMLAAQRREPGRPAVPPREPLLLSAEEARRALVCRLEAKGS